MFVPVRLIRHDWGPVANSSQIALIKAPCRDTRFKVQHRRTCALFLLGQLVVRPFSTMPARASDGVENSVVPSAPNKMEQERKRGERDNHEKQSLLRMSGRPSHGIDKSVTRPDPIRFCKNWIRSLKTPAVATGHEQAQSDYTDFCSYTHGIAYSCHDYWDTWQSRKLSAWHSTSRADR